MRERTMSVNTRKMIDKAMKNYVFSLEHVVIEKRQVERERDEVLGFLATLLSIDMINSGEYTDLITEVYRLESKKVVSMSEETEEELSEEALENVPYTTEEELPEEALENIPFTYNYILSWRGVRKIVKKESYYFGELVEGDENIEDIYNSGVVYIGDWRIEFIPEIDSVDNDIMSRRVLITEVKYEYV